MNDSLSPVNKMAWSFVQRGLNTRFKANFAGTKNRVTIMMLFTFNPSLFRALVAI